MNFNIEIVFETNGIDNTKPSNKAYLKRLNRNKTLVEFPIYIKLRECKVGETFTDAGKYIFSQ